jgi:HAD superfamily hydrolase (TIGR01490 family)
MTQSADNRRIGAFFDVDGTLVPPPSLEHRFFAELRRRRAIPAKNYFLWLAHALRLMPQGITKVQHANKMYLRGVCVAEISDGDGKASANLFGPAGIPVVSERAFDRLIWHAKQGHAIVLVTGTLAPLARNFALQMIIKLAVRGITASIGVCATELEEVDGRWTWRIIGEPMFGEGKARAVRRVACEHGLDLARSYAYGDTASDRWLLEAVGRPTTVNPSVDLERIARRQDWPVTWWNEKTKESPRSLQREAQVFVGPGDLG